MPTRKPTVQARTTFTLIPLTAASMSTPPRRLDLAIPYRNRGKWPEDNPRRYLKHYILQLPGFCPVNSSVRQRPALLEQKIFHVSQNKRGRVRASLGPQTIKLGAFHLVHPERRASVFFYVAHLHVVHAESIHVANKEPVGRQLPKHCRLRVRVLLLWRIQRGLFFSSSALTVNANIAEQHVLDWMTGNT